MEKIGQLLSQVYYWSNDVALIESPMVILIGNGDSVRLSHAVELF